MGTVHDRDGKELCFEAAVTIMDDDIREKLHMELAPCTEQEFFVAYAKEHEDRHGEGFAPYIGGNW